MHNRLLAKSRTQDGLDARVDEPLCSPVAHPGTEEEDPEAEALLKTRIAESIQRIGSNLDRMLVILDRMDRKLEEATR